MPNLILVRHGETIWNAERRFQGAQDVPLSPRGEAQARALAARLAGESIQRIYSSDLQRAHVTATLIAEPHGLPVQIEPRLREISFGAWEGMTYEGIHMRYPEGLAWWEADPMNAAPPGGETLAQLQERVESLLAELAALPADETALLVGHGGSLQVLLCVALGLVPRARWQFRLDPGSLSELGLYPAGAILTSLNDRHHLACVP